MPGYQREIQERCKGIQGQPSLTMIEDPLKLHSKLAPNELNSLMWFWMKIPSLSTWHFSWHQESTVFALTSPFRSGIPSRLLLSLPHCPGGRSRFREIHLVLWGHTVMMGFKAMGLGVFFCFPFFDLQWKFQKYTVMTDLIFNTTACQKSRFLTLSQLALTTPPMWWTLSGPLTWEAWEDHSHQANLKEVGTSLQTPFGLCAYQHSMVVKNLFVSVVLTVIM